MLSLMQAGLRHQHTYLGPSACTLTPTCRTRSRSTAQQSAIRQHSCVCNYAPQSRLIQKLAVHALAASEISCWDSSLASAALTCSQCCALLACMPSTNLWRPHRCRWCGMSVQFCAQQQRSCSAAQRVRACEQLACKRMHRAAKLHACNAVNLTRPFFIPAPAT